jgi:hypothetical protein
MSAFGGKAGIAHGFSGRGQLQLKIKARAADSFYLSLVPGMDQHRLAVGCLEAPTGYAIHPPEL